MVRPFLDRFRDQMAARTGMRSFYLNLLARCQYGAAFDCGPR
jgi:hypothetical protein